MLVNAVDTASANPPAPIIGVSCYIVPEKIKPHVFKVLCAHGATVMSFMLKLFGVGGGCGLIRLPLDESDTAYINLYRTAQAFALIDAVVRAFDLPYKVPDYVDIDKFLQETPLTSDKKQDDVEQSKEATDGMELLTDKPEDEDFNIYAPANNDFLADVEFP